MIYYKAKKAVAEVCEYVTICGKKKIGKEYMKAFVCMNMRRKKQIFRASI